MFCSFVVLNGTHLNIGRIRMALNFPTSRMKVGPADLRSTASVLVCLGWHPELVVRLDQPLVRTLEPWCYSRGQGRVLSASGYSVKFIP